MCTHAHIYIKESLRQCALGGDDDALQKGEGAIVQFHLDGLQGLTRRLNVQQVQNDRLVGSQGATGRDHGADGVANLACVNGGPGMKEDERETKEGVRRVWVRASVV